MRSRYKQTRDGLWKWLGARPMNDSLTETLSPDTEIDGGEKFADLLKEHQITATDESLEGSVLRGRVVAFDGDYVVVDVGLKSEGRIHAHEFKREGELEGLKKDDIVEVYLDRLEDSQGIVVLSREKARREEAWARLVDVYNAGTPVEGIIQNRVKGGYVVDLKGATGFLPSSQVDIRPQSNITHLMGSPQRFKILKMDRNRGNLVVSRRSVLEEERSAMLEDTMSRIKEGEIFTGIVKNVTEYGAFVDLGGVDGLLHVTDISWQRVNHPSEHLRVGQQVTVQITRYNPETQRLSLGMKQLEADPWQGTVERFPVGTKLKGRVSNITDYGAFVQLEPGIEGLVHISEMSWSQRNVHPRKLVSVSQEVDVVVLDIDEKRRRVSLGMKQALPNPWNEFAERHPTGSEVTGKVKNITNFGLFIELEEGVDGMVHFADLSWDKPGEEVIKEYHRGQQVTAKVTNVDSDRCRISLSIKHLTEDPFEDGDEKHKIGATVTCTISSVFSGGVEVTLGDEKTPGVIKKAELSRERDGQDPNQFAAGEKVDAKIVSRDKKARRFVLSIKQLQIEEAEQAVADYGSTESGAQLGEILGASKLAALAPTGDDTAKAPDGAPEAPDEAPVADDSPEPPDAPTEPTDEPKEAN